MVFRKMNGCISSIFYICLIILGLGCRDKSTNNNIIIDPPVNGATVIDWDATWCITNNYIAYIHGESAVYPNTDSAGVYIIRPDGSGKRVLIYGHQLKGIDWNPNGDWLVLHASNYLIRLSFPGGEMDTLMSTGEFWAPACSPNGQNILSVVRTGSNGIYSVDTDGEGYKLIIPYGDYPSWIYPDSFIYLNRSSEFPVGSICISDSAGIFRRLLIEGNYIHATYFKEISANVQSKRIVFNPHIPNDTVGIWKYQLLGETLSELISLAKYPTLSPDGEKVVFTDITHGTGNLRMINWNGSELISLTDPINGGGK
jgi:hypothetical protein